MSGEIKDLPHAVEHEAEVNRRLAGRKLAVFLDYDGTLSPIVENPMDAVITENMQRVVKELAGRCTVCVVSGRDTEVVQELMGLDDMIVAGSHGFDIWSPTEGTIEHDAASGHDELLDRVRNRLSEELKDIEGVSFENKKASVAVHYRRASEEDHPKVKRAVEGILEDDPDGVKVTPGKMVFELQPKVDWNKGRAVLYLLEILQLDGEDDDVVPIYIGDDVTDEDAFRALAERGGGLGIYVGDRSDPDAGRTTAADYALDNVDEVETFLDALAR
ncbi:trehalose-phosphatase [Rubrobacter indicoceani]|uniref:trehalose-phosphatase n=1 Tax=Rubrobacter indicoceani TaxID=2051957 RepID=UPI000E5C12FB|nr:trehalose-phosphatase [Rubrobacter indicoceani]